MKLRLQMTFWVLTISTAVYAQQMKPSLNYITAQKILSGCIAYADSNKLNMAVAVFDSNGQLLCFAKMDGSSAGTAKVAHWKGLSAAIYQYPTSQTATWNVPNAPDLATVPGGLVITTAQGHAIGGVGVSGSGTDDDVKCATAGLKAAGLIYTTGK
jgi:glc operon protein GlcG